MARSPHASAADRLLLPLLAVGWAWIAWASQAYFLPGPLHPFIVDKLPLFMGGLPRAVLLAHVVSALIALPACILLLSDRVRASSLTVHRVLGRITAVVVLFALVPSGAYLALSATGGIASTAGFLLSGLIMAVSMVRAVITARRREIAEHRRFTRHVLGQMAVAIISRLMLVGAGALELDPTTAYIASLWVPVVGVAMWVEQISKPVPHNAPRGDIMNIFARTLLLLFLALGVVSQGSQAAPNDGPAAQVRRLLVEPLAARESNTSRFSRAPRPPIDRRVRVLAETPSADVTGAWFYSFAIDNRWSREADAAWETEAMVGCIYPDSGRVFVQRGDAFISSAWLLGLEGEEAPASACQRQ